MSEEFLDKIWDKFSKENREESRGIYGSGLGLSMVKRYVNLLGGTISVNSKVGVGSEFKVEIELDRVDRVKKNKEIGDLHILLADDNDINREIFVELLSYFGITVTEAKDGKEACEIFEERAQIFDAIIMDMRMPIKDGFKATKHIRNSNHLNAKTIPIIAMTANTANEQIEKAFAYGANAYISKPINIEQLVQIINRLCCQ